MIWKIFVSSKRKYNEKEKIISMCEVAYEINHELVN